jgi:SAM-dependent methyltransferase
MTSGQPAPARGGLPWGIEQESIEATEISPCGGSHSVKTRESGMPDEAVWAGFFDPESVLRKLHLVPSCGDVVEFGCGYGTFTVPAARIVSGMVYAMDIEPEMLAATKRKADAARVDNVKTCLRDFVAHGTGLPGASVDYAMLFNILHAECPHVLLQETFRVLRPGGVLAVIHWNYAPTTPRGPSMDIRPRPEQCLGWVKDVGFRPLEPGIVDLPPYHYGMALERP